MTSLDPHNPIAIPDMQGQVRERFASLARRLRQRVALEGLAWTVCTFVGLVLLGMLLDRWLELSVLARLICWAVVLAAVAHVAFWHLLVPMRAPLDPVSLAGVLDRKAHHEAELAPRVATVLQLPDLLDHPHAPSPLMVSRAVQHSYAAIRDVDLDHRLNPKQLQQALGLIAACLVVPALFVLVFHATAGLGFKRWFALSHQPWPRDTTLMIDGLADGVLIVPRGEPVELRVAVTDRDEPTEVVRLRLKPEGGQRTSTNLEAFAPGDFRHSLAPVAVDTVAELSGGDAALGPFVIRPIDRPRITDLTLNAKHANDDQPTIMAFSGSDGDLALLPHTDATLTLTANVPLDAARYVGDHPADHAVLPEPVRVNERTFTLSWNHQQTMRFNLELVSAEGDLASYPIPITITLRPDRPPRISLTHSGVKQRITAEALVPLKIAARDDHGLHSVSLNPLVQLPPTPVLPGSETPSTPRQTPTIPTVVLLSPASPPTQTLAELRHELDLAPHALQPGDLLTITASAEDDGYVGIQHADSRTLSFRIVTRDELFREILLRQQGLRSTLREAAIEAQAQADELGLARDPAAAAELRHRFSAMQRQVWSVSRTLNETAEEMRLNRLAGQESFELMDRNILQPLAALHDQTMTRQRQSIEALAKPDATGDDLTDVAQRQDQIVAELNEILRQMDQWDSFIDVVNQLNEIIKLQTDVRDSTRSIEKQETEGLFDD